MAHAKTSLDKKKARKALRQMPEEDPEFQIAPMIDVLLVLLVFFMSISSTQVLQVTKNVVLPVAADGKEIEVAKDQALINVTYLTAAATSSIEMNQRNYQVPEDLMPELKASAENRPEYKVVVRADKNTKYGFLRKILATVGQAGIKNVTFSVTDKETADK